MQVRVLGTSPPLATLRFGNAGTGLLVSSGEAHVLVDCGPGVTHHLHRAGIDVRAVGTILLTHHHWDHTADLAHFVLGRWEASLFGAIGGKDFAAPLTIFGPEGTAALIDRLFGEAGAFCGDIATRLAPDIGVALYTARGVPLPFPPVSPAVTEIAAGDEFALGRFRLRAATAHHCEPYLASLAYRFEADERTLVFSGDASPSPGVAELARGADLLLHDCNVRIVRETLVGKQIHSTPDEVGQIAAAARVKTLVVVHHGLRPEDSEARERLETAIRRHYDGEIAVAQELDMFAL